MIGVPTGSSLSGVSSEMGRHEDAIAMAGRYVQLAPSDANAADTLGLAYENAGQNDHADEAFTHALALKPEFGLAALHRAMLYGNMGRVREAVQELLRVEQGLTPAERKRAWSAAAWILWRRGQNAEAKSVAAKALQLRIPDVGDWNPAFLLLSKSAVTKPGSEAQVGRGGRFGARTVLFYLACEERSNGRTEQMLEHLRRLLRARPMWGELEPLEDTLADAYFQMERGDEAIAEYERALRVFPGMAMARFHLAQAYQRRGRAAEAGAQFRQFLDLWKHADVDLPELAEARRAVPPVAR
jgi:tetratricopeptide (TPR) repeat protein